MDINEHERLSNIEFIYDIQLLVESSLLDDEVDTYIQYTQGHIVVVHLQRRTACHV
jgi:hypothetical protein